MKKGKPKAKYKVFTLYWWNPLVYIGIILCLFYSMWDGGVKSYLKEITRLITKYNWK
jgi:hypothetical protein